MSIICSSLEWQRRNKYVVKTDTTSLQTTKTQIAQEIYEKRMAARSADKLKKFSQKIQKKDEMLSLIREGLEEPSSKRTKIEKNDDIEFLVEDYERLTRLFSLILNMNSDEESLISRQQKLLQRIRAESEDEETELNDEVSIRKVYYCSRTHTQLSQFLHEIKKTEFASSIKVVSLGSRKNLCINPTVLSITSPSRMNDKCLDLIEEKKSSA